jgi:hypothetical protein
MMLWNSVLLFEAASRKSRIAWDDTPSASGVLLGSEVIICASSLQPFSKRRKRSKARLIFLQVNFIGYQDLGSMKDINVLNNLKYFPLISQNIADRIDDLRKSAESAGNK